MSKAGETFFTTVGCMDGRVQEPVAKFGRGRFAAEYPDTITEAGLVGLLARGSGDQSLVDSIKNKINISLEKHHSKGIIVHGHQECAGNPVDDNRHKDDTRRSLEIIKSFVSPSVPVVGVFVKRETNGWEIEEI